MREIIFVHGSVSLTSASFVTGSDLLFPAESLHIVVSKGAMYSVGMTAEEILKRKEEKGKRAVFFYESAKRSVLAAEVLLRRLETELAELEPILSDAEKLSERFGPILITAMGIVDFAHRFG